MNESLTYKTEKRIYDILPHEPEMMFTVLFIIAMSAYYLWRMFAITPQYDELYTYYTFISRGPIYSAIHWPLPNNHVGFSVISAVLDLFGNSYIGLRGISFVCAISNLVLVNRICRRYFSHALPLGATVLYASMQVVNDYSVQGRGYTLAATCFLLSIYAAGNICSLSETKKSSYVALCFAFCYGLYTVPSSIYWVLPVSLAVAIFLLINGFRSSKVYASFKENVYYQKFRLFFFSGLTAAGITVVLYVLIWLAIGSNLLVKTEGTQFFGLSHGTVLLRAPVSCVRTGIDYMLSQPYIQSLSPEEFSGRYVGWNFSLFNYMIPGASPILLSVVIISLVIVVAECLRHFEYSRTVLNLLIICNLLVPTAMLIIQRKLPYLRVFGYGAAITVFCFCTLCESVINVAIRFYNSKKTGKKRKDSEKSAAHKEIETTVKGTDWYSGIGVYIPAFLMCVVFVIRFFSYDFNAQLGTRENNIFNTLYVANVQNRHNIAVLDCDQQYLLKFGWDIDCDKTDVSGADCVIIDKNMFEAGYSGENFWKFYQTYETIDWDYIDTMRQIYQNEDVILYVK